MDVVHCDFNYNKASGAISASYGGAIYSDTVDVENSTFADNYADENGGAIWANTLNINAKQSTPGFNTFFYSNNAECGGAVYASKGNIVNARFADNKASHTGGAISVHDCEVKNCYFYGNEATKDGMSNGGGAIYATELTVSNSTFQSNNAKSRGGAIRCEELTVRSNTYFIRNTAGINGGAIFTHKFKNDLKNVAFIENEAKSDDGGAVYVLSETWVTFENCVFSNNHCKDEGGAIYMDSMVAHVTLKNNIFIGNTAKKEGQSVFNCGYYDKINNNWWGDKNPSSSNDQLVEWKSMPWQSNVRHSDSNPLKMKVGLFAYSCDVNDTVNGKIWFETSNGLDFTGDIWGLDAVSITSNPKINVLDLKPAWNSITFKLNPQQEAIYDLTFSLYGYSVKTKLYVVNVDIVAPEVSTAKGTPATFKVHLEGKKSFVANQKITVVLNSKEYNAVTDENGDAIIKFDAINTPGKYDVVISTMGDFGISSLNVI